MRKFFAAAVLTFAGFGFTTPAIADGTIYVIHGIPGQDLGLDPALPVDVLVNDEICLLEGFTFGEITDPLPLPAGVYNIKISPANPDDPCGNDFVINDFVIEANVEVFDDETATIIAHLTDMGDPTASKFVNDLTPTMPGKSRVVVHHTAAAPPVDVTARRGSSRNQAAVIENLMNGDQAMANLRPGNWRVSIAPAGLMDPVLGPVKVRFQKKSANFVYAVGSLDNGTLTLLTNVIPTMTGR